jgi:hypothetical protein
MLHGVCSVEINQDKSAGGRKANYSLTSGYNKQKSIALLAKRISTKEHRQIDHITKSVFYRHTTMSRVSIVAEASCSVFLLSSAAQSRCAS